MGIHKCLDRVMQSEYWPGLTRDVEEFIAGRDVCCKFQKRQQRKPLIAHVIPDSSWEKVTMDILHFRGSNYLVVVNFYRTFPELRLLSLKTAEDLIQALKSTFAVHGVPVDVVADNMPALWKLSIKEFCQ